MLYCIYNCIYIYIFYLHVYIWLNDVSYDFHPKLSDFMWVDEQHTNMHAVGVSKPYPKK